MQKLFVISDIHGHYSVMKNALDEAGFNPSEATHHLLCLGDYFDRGQENTEVFEYLYDLEKKGKASFILGNHDLFLLDFLSKDFSKASFNAAYNGFGQTLNDFSGLDVNQESFEAIYDAIHKNYPMLYEWLKGLVLFIETEDYIFTHGGIDLSLPDWKAQDKRSFVWNYMSELSPPNDKIVVVGHERTPMIRAKFAKQNNDPYDPMNCEILKDNHVIYIDGFVEKTHHINVLNIYLNKPLKK